MTWRYAGVETLPRLTVQQETQRCRCGRYLASWTVAHEVCCRCMCSPTECQCRLTDHPHEGCLSLDLANVREPDGDDPKCEVRREVARDE